MNAQPTLAQDSHTDWRCRWLMPPTGRAKLHRVATIVWAGDSETYGEGTTVCGLKYTLCIPGMNSRFGRPRCPKCCAKLSIPAGDGAPMNDESLTEAQKEA